MKEEITIIFLRLETIKVNSGGQNNTLYTLFDNIQNVAVSFRYFKIFYLHQYRGYFGFKNIGFHCVYNSRILEHRVTFEYLQNKCK